MSIIASLERGQGFTATDEAVARYILEHLAEVINMSAAELAEASHSSKASVSRLCRRLGLDGYRSFSIELAREIEHTYAFGINLDRPFEEKSDPREVADAIATLQTRAVSDTRSFVDPLQLRKAAALITQAPHVILLGLGDSVPALEEFGGLLFKSGIPCISGYALNDLYSLNAIVRKGDVTVAVSYSGKMFYQLLEQMEGIPHPETNMVFVTSDLSVRKAQNKTDAFIQLPRHENPAERIAPFYSSACVRYALTCIYGEVLVSTWETSNAEHLRLSHAGITGD